MKFVGAKPTTGDSLLTPSCALAAAYSLTGGDLPSAASATCDIAHIEKDCANIDSSDRANCNTPCHTTALANLAACKVEQPQVAVRLGEMVATCSGH